MQGMWLECNPVGRMICIVAMVINLPSVYIVLPIIPCTWHFLFCFSPLTIPLLLFSFYPSAVACPCCWQSRGRMFCLSQLIQRIAFQMLLTRSSPSTLLWSEAMRTFMPWWVCQYSTLVGGERDNVFHKQFDYRTEFSVTKTGIYKESNYLYFGMFLCSIMCRRSTHQSWTLTR